jgi:hypothetical protein
MEPKKLPSMPSFKFGSGARPLPTGSGNAAGAVALGHDPTNSDPAMT